MRVDGKGVDLDVVNDPVSLVSASQQPWEICPSLQSPGSHFSTFPAETLLMRELKKVAVKVFTLYEMKSTVFMDTFRIRNGFAHAVKIEP